MLHTQQFNFFFKKKRSGIDAFKLLRKAMDTPALLLKCLNYKAI